MSPYYSTGILNKNKYIFKGDNYVKIGFAPL